MVRAGLQRAVGAQPIARGGTGRKPAISRYAIALCSNAQDEIGVEFVHNAAA